MANYLKRSRITKVLTDSNRAGSFPEAEARLNKVRIEVIVGNDQLTTHAGQAATLTAVATARKCFGRVMLVAPNDSAMTHPLPIGDTLLRVARNLGARISQTPSGRATHSIRIGAVLRTDGWNLRCWWDRWLSGARTHDSEPLGDSRLALSGVFSGAIAVRQVFACVLAGHNIPERDVSVSLWTPWQPANSSEIGPENFDMPDKLWLLGLGHLGQAYVWNLCFLSTHGQRLAVLQDDQEVSEENEATSLLVLPGGNEIGVRKARVATPWLESCGWKTELIERRHMGDISLVSDDPPYLLSGVDRIKPRLTLAKHGFPYMVDAGIGHGAADFEGIQFRTVANGKPSDGLWESDSDVDTERSAQRLLERSAYRELEKQIGTCGRVPFLEAGVAVPFVGAAAGAITVAQTIRLASLESVPEFLQMQLGAPEMTTFASLIARPEVNLGSIAVSL